MRKLTLDEVHGRLALTAAPPGQAAVFQGYQSLTADERQLAIAEAVHMREQERFHYALNAYTYQELLARPEVQALPAEWPYELQRWRYSTRDLTAAEMAAAGLADKVELVHALQRRDRWQLLLRTELAELAAVEALHAQALRCADPQQLPEMLQRARVTREALRGGQQ